ncbi:MAG: ATP-binding protein [Chloroflexi bacterium]|nr:ATP-binding protein [Chloroflexota bacterium]
MSAPATVTVLKDHLADLGMPGSLEAVDGLLERLDSGAISATEAMVQLLDAQITLRRERRLIAAMRSSRLPALKTLESFDFAFQPSIDRGQLLNLHELTFVESDCVKNQGRSGCQHVPLATTAFSMTMSLRTVAVSATFFGLPAATSL